jgi:hypothetical protein
MLGFSEWRWLELYLHLHHVSRPLGYVVVDRWICLPLWRTGESGGASDSPVWPDRRWLFLTSDRFWLGGNRPLASCGEVDRWTWAQRTVQCTPDSLVKYSRRALSFSRERPVRRAHQPGHRTLFGAPQTGANLTRPIFIEMTQESIFLTDVYGPYAPEKRSTRQTS